MMNTLGWNIDELIRKSKLSRKAKRLDRAINKVNEAIAHHDAAGKQLQVALNILEEARRDLDGDKAQAPTQRDIEGSWGL